jgi:hypothetical protein
MVIRTRLTAAIAAGLILASSAAMGDDSKPKTDTPTAAADNPSCVSQTGSMISAKGKCRGNGHSYTKDDINRTGKTTLAGALSVLDPSISIRR